MRHKILDAIRIFMGIGDVDGVSTKFLANYLYWFKWLQCFSEDKESIKSKNIIVHSTTNFVDTRITVYKGREPIFM